MIYTTFIEASEESLRMLDEKFSPITKDRFIYCLQQKNRWSIEDVQSFIARLKISYSYTMKEFKRMQKLSSVYNLEYPTNHKDYFSTAKMLMGKMRSTLSSYKSIASEFRPKKKRCSRVKGGKTVFELTPLYNGAYSQDIFGMDAYPDKSVKELLYILNNYLELAKKCVDLCIGMIDVEKAIRANPEWAHNLYKISFDRSVRNNQSFIESMKQHCEQIDDDIKKAMEDAQKLKQQIAQMYHTINHSDFNFYCACIAIGDGRNVGMTPEESILFGKDNHEKVIRIRALLDHILELAEQRNDVKRPDGRFGGEFLMHLLYWCGWDGSKNDAMLNYVVNCCKGKIESVKIGTVCYHKNKLAHLDIQKTKEQQAEFDAQMDRFVDSILNKTGDNSN